MLRPLLAFATLCLAAFLLAPTVASVHERVTELSFDRDMPWEIWKWTDEPTPGMPDCQHARYQLYSEIVQWPDRIRKDEAFSLRGIVRIEEEDQRGVEDIEVDVFLNETKEEPGILLGKATTGPGGFFWVTTRVPFDLKASHYHIVAHAKERTTRCEEYHEHWSDPETDVISSTELEIKDVRNAVVGREVEVRGQLVDSVGAAVPGANVTVTIDGEPFTVRTNGDGGFRVPWTPDEPGTVKVVAEFAGSYYYTKSRNETTIQVDTEDLELALPRTGLALLRSTPFPLHGQVYLAPDAQKDEVTLTFEGVRVATCPNCTPQSTLRVPLDASGKFQVDLVVPASEKPGDGTLTVTGGGLRRSYAHNVTVTVPTNLTLAASNGGLFAKRFEAEAQLTDEVGRPLAGPVALRGPDGWASNRTNASGVAAFAASAECGRHALRAQYNGSSHVAPATSEQEVVVCGYLAFVPPWLLAVPWWVWPAAILGGLAAWRLARSLRQTYASTILTGPPLTIAFTQPRDDASGYAAVGETVVATAFLEDPLPDGHTLRMGTSRATEVRPLDAELRAHLTVSPQKLGQVPVRAEIVDAKGRVVSRRTITLRVVRYGEEIERRYLALRARSGAKEHVTPREFERWLREQAPGLDAEVARRLVLLFEEADYGPRAAGRAELAAYLAAERGVQEVTQDATLA